MELGGNEGKACVVLGANGCALAMVTRFDLVTLDGGDPRANRADFRRDWQAALLARALGRDTPGLIESGRLARSPLPEGGRGVFEGMEPVEFEHDGTQLRGYAARPDASGPVPAVLVMHSALGIAHGVNEPIARKLADQGYLAVCTDMYGAHLEGASMEDAGLAYGENLAASRSATRSYCCLVRRDRTPIRCRRSPHRRGRVLLRRHDRARAGAQRREPQGGGELSRHPDHPRAG